MAKVSPPELALTLNKSGPSKSFWDTDKKIYLINADYVDYDAYYHAKSIHSINIPPDVVNTDEKWYLSVLNGYEH
jgi:hypothetical protein